MVLIGIDLIGEHITSSAERDPDDKYLILAFASDVITLYF